MMFRTERSQPAEHPGLCHHLQYGVGPKTSGTFPIALVSHHTRDNHRTQGNHRTQDSQDTPNEHTPATTPEQSNC